MGGETLLALAYESVMVLAGLIAWLAVIRFYGDDDER